MKTSATVHSLDGGVGSNVPVSVESGSTDGRGPHDDNHTRASTIQPLDALEAHATSKRLSASRVDSQSSGEDRARQQIRLGQGSLPKREEVAIAELYGNVQFSGSSTLALLHQVSRFYYKSRL